MLAGLVVDSRQAGFLFMNQAIQSKMLSGQRKIQKLWGETVQFGPMSPNPPPIIPAIMGSEIITQRFIEGRGLDEVTTLAVSIVISDLERAPFIGMAAQARGRSWTVFLVNPTQTTWEITLESRTK